MTCRLAAITALLAVVATAPIQAQDSTESNDSRRVRVRPPRIEVIVPRHRTYFRFDPDHLRFHERRLRLHEPWVREFAFREDAFRRRAQVQDELRFRMEERIRRRHDRELDRSEQAHRRAAVLLERMRDRGLERSEDVRRRLEERMRDLEGRLLLRRERSRAI